MEPKKENIYHVIENEILISRFFEAPREMVWKAWTEPDLVKAWWGPKGYSIPVCKINLKLGGEYHLCMHSPEGQNFWSKGTYLEVVKNEKLVMTDSFSDEEGNILPASAYGMSGDWPSELLISVTFDDYEDKTRIVIRHVGTPEGEMTDLTEKGWKESIDKLSVLIEEENKKLSVQNSASTKLDINPYLNFPGNAEEAFTFYKSVFGGEFIMIMRYRETPDGEKFPPELQDKIMHIAMPLGKNGNILMATDVIEPIGQKIINGNNFYISISAGSKAEADRIFNRLSEGGAVEMAMNTTFWGSYFGMFRDKFGVQWMISSSNND